MSETRDDIALGAQIAQELMDRLKGQSAVMSIIIMGHILAATELAIKMSGKVPNRSRIFRHVGSCADQVDVTMRAEN